MDRFRGKTAVITGAARGQGRSHAVRLAAEGADVVLDLCHDIDSVAYDLAGPGDLAETARLVREHGRRVVAGEVDVRDADALTSAVTGAARELGGINVVLANAESASCAGTSRRAWRSATSSTSTSSACGTRPCRGAAADRAGPRRGRRPHQLGVRPHRPRRRRHRRHRRIRGGQARGRRADAHVRELARAPRDPGHLRQPVRGGHPHGPQPGGRGDVSAGARIPSPTRVPPTRSPTCSTSPSSRSTTSPPRSRSSPPTRPATSRAPRCRSTPACSCGDRREHHAPAAA